MNMHLRNGRNGKELAPCSLGGCTYAWALEVGSWEDNLMPLAACWEHLQFGFCCSNQQGQLVAAFWRDWGEGPILHFKILIYSGELRDPNWNQGATLYLGPCQPLGCKASGALVAATLLELRQGCGSMETGTQDSGGQVLPRDLWPVSRRAPLTRLGIPPHTNVYMAKKDLCADLGCHILGQAGPRLQTHRERGGGLGWGQEVLGSAPGLSHPSLVQPTAYSTSGDLGKTQEERESFLVRLHIPSCGAWLFQEVLQPQVALSV